MYHLIGSLPDAADGSVIMFNKKTGKQITTLLALLAAAAVLSACGHSASSSADYARTESVAAGSMYYEEPAMAPEEAYDIGDNGQAGLFGEEIAEVPDSSRKLIKNVSLDVETEDIDELDRAVIDKTNALGGYIERENKSGKQSSGSSYSGRRYASYTIRIPAGRIDEFVEDISGKSNVLSQSSYVEDITLNYVDMESRVSSLETQRDRLLAMLESAKTVEDMIYIESELSNVRYQLESYGSQLRLYDNLVSYATVNLSVSEVLKLTDTTVPQTAGERIRKGISTSFVNVVEGIGEFFINLIIILPYLILLAIIVLIILGIVFLCIKAGRKHAEKRAQKAAAKKAAKAAANTAQAAAGTVREQGKEAGK